MPRLAASGEGSDVVVALCAQCGWEADERWTIVERWTWWSDGYGGLLPFCPQCAEREFGHRVVRLGGEDSRLTPRALTLPQAERRRGAPASGSAAPG